MSRARDYLRTVLTPEQYATFQQHANLDSRDSTARAKWAMCVQNQPRNAKRIKSARAWLYAYGYIRGDQWVADVPFLKGPDS